MRRHSRIRIVWGTSLVLRCSISRAADLWVCTSGLCVLVAAGIYGVCQSVPGLGIIITCAVPLVFVAM